MKLDAELVSLKADTQFIPPLKAVRFLAQFLANLSSFSSGFLSKLDLDRLHR